jgi:PAS domain S-box-containing protein
MPSLAYSGLSLRELDALFDQSPIALVFNDCELRTRRTNAAFRRLTGLVDEATIGRRPTETNLGVDAAWGERTLAEQVINRGVPVVDVHVEQTVAGERRVLSWSAYRVTDDGHVLGAVGLLTDVTDRVQANARLGMLERAGSQIGTTLDITRTAEELLDVAVPRLADAGSVDLLATVIEGDRRAPQAHHQEMRLQEAAQRWPADVPPLPGSLPFAWSETDPATLIRQRLAAGLPVFLPTFGAMTEAQIKEITSDTNFDRLLAAHRAGAHSMIVVPLIARRVIMGVVGLCRLAGSPPFTDADLSLACDFVSHAAVAVDNARLYTRERATALALQRGLLPRQIPEVPGLQLACRYVPAETAAEAGGDWFDVIALPQGRCALTVGDVTGHDVTAASLMGQLRTATRTLATLGLDPADVLTRLDQIAADLTDAETSATCLYATCDPGAGSWEIASAGHPPPALARPGHPGAFPRLPAGLPLGTGIGDGTYGATRLHLPPGSTLLLYTDGLIEDPAADIDTGMRRLSRTLTTASQLPVSRACDAVLAALAPSPADDIALLIARA